MTAPAAPTDRAPAPAPAPAKLRRRSRSAVARSAGGDRWTMVIVGLVLLAAGVLVALLSYGVFGAARAGRPLLDPMIVDTLRAQPLVSRIVAIVAGVVLALLGLVWASNSVRPERRPDLLIDGGPDTSIVVSSAAAADAVASQAGGLPGVGRAKARLVGDESAPALRVTLWLADDADVRDVLRRLDSHVLTTARESLGLSALPVAVRLELDRSHPTSRVA
ncbi:alkaline shock response membrane anchor protein AmaP [Pseudonocardia sp.]|uniref:alkaline shock response membrane anchor protein AmaP n=1 Tax=Pseudonocardia sp. TaxID=60912 RepID=UPI0025F0D106|nr:alkaline shock response membrane anchor protein AmaP [Pseudonocardia sp.]